MCFTESLLCDSVKWSKCTSQRLLTILNVGEGLTSYLCRAIIDTTSSIWPSTYRGALFMGEDKKLTNEQIVEQFFDFADWLHRKQICIDNPDIVRLVHQLTGALMWGNAQTIDRAFEDIGVFMERTFSPEYDK